MAATKNKSKTTNNKTTAKKTTARKTTTRAKRVTVVPDQGQVRQRAFEIYKRRGGEPGHELEDWLQAEKELTH